MLYLSGEKPKSIAEVIERVTCGGHWKMNFYTGGATYHDEDCKQLHCREDKYRSFDDVLEVCHTYFPNVSVRRIFRQALLLNVKRTEHVKAGMEVLPQLYDCGTMRRIRLMYLHEPNTVSHKQRESKYSWPDLCKMVGVEPEIEAVKEFINKHKIEK